jgi:SAM-dependent methyltransferase
MDPQKRRAVFWDLHSGLPREGPGRAETTKRALELAAPVPRSANVLDIASGPGAQTIDLARLLPEATIWAIDTHQPFVDETNRRTAGLGDSHRVKALCGDMRSLLFPHSTFDLVWCVGAAFMGVESALRLEAGAAPRRQARLQRGRLALFQSARRSPAQLVRLSGHGGCAPLARCGAHQRIGASWS